MSDLDVSELQTLAASFDSASREVVGEVRKIAQVAALKIKRGMASDAQGHPHSPAFPSSITYDTRFTATGGVEAEIGPDKDRTQGALGNILYFGTAKNGPVLDLTGPLRREAPIVEDFVAKAATKALEQ